MHSENIWFSWSKPSNYREKLICHACDGRTDERRRRKVENRAVFCWTRNRKSVTKHSNSYWTQLCLDAVRQSLKRQTLGNHKSKWCKKVQHFFVLEKWIFQILMRELYFFFLSDPSPIIVYSCHELTDSLTNWLTDYWLTDCRLVNLIDVTLACEDGNSKLVEVYSATYSTQFLKVMKSFSRLESYS